MPIKSTLLFVLVSVVAASAVAATPTVEMVILAEPSQSTITTGRKWADALRGVGITDVQIRGAGPADKPGIQSLGTPQAPSYRVVGELSGTRLIIPGHQFSLADRGDVAKWLKELGENGVAGVTEKKGAFGLLGKQLAEVRDDLAQPINFSTKGMTAPQVVEKIRQQLKLKLDVDAAADKALADDDPVRDELTGLSCGTVLAAIARPAGDILQPQKPEGGELQHTIVKAAAGVESWPIGWPPEQSEAKVLPQLLDSLNVEIRDTPAATAVAALQAKFKVPFLFDHNSMAKQRIDLAKKNVTLPPKKMLYASVLRQVLFQAGLKYSVRVDEANSPLIWITTLK